MTTELDNSWETETGLVHDVDAWIKNPHFGEKEEYAAKLAETGAEGGKMFLVDLADENGEIIGNQGWSIGTGWIVSEDGKSISHPKRHNVVGSCRYGQLQNRVVGELAVDMKELTKKPPTDATAWDGMGFHWMQEEHETVGKDVKTSLMPTLYLGIKADGGGPTPAPATTPAVVPTDAPTSDAEAKLAQMAGLMELKAFQAAALGMAEVTGNDALMAQVLDGGDTGFWTTHRAS